MVLMKVAKTIRTHKKKVIFFTGVGAVAVNYARDKYILYTEMRKLCTDADQKGKQLVKQRSGVGRIAYEAAAIEAASNSTEPEEIFVLLQPNARGGKGREHFNKYGAPLLHLAGKKITLVTARSAEEARTYCEALDTCRYLMVAGDDAVILNALTGYLQRYWDAERGIPKQLPSTTIAIVPLQKRSVYASTLLPGNDTEKSSRNMSSSFSKWWQKKKVKPFDIAQSAQGVLGGQIRMLNVMHVQVENTMPPQLRRHTQQHDKAVPTANTDVKRQDFFSFCSVQAGPVAESEQVADRYWYFGFLRDKFAALRTMLSNIRNDELLPVRCATMLSFQRQPEIPAAERAAQQLVNQQKKQLEAQDSRSWLSRFSPQRTVSKKVVDAMQTNATADALEVAARDDEIKWQQFQTNSSWLVLRPETPENKRNMSALTALILPSLSWLDFLKLKWFSQYRDQTDSPHGFGHDASEAQFFTSKLVKLAFPKLTANASKQGEIIREINQRSQHGLDSSASAGSDSTASDSSAVASNETNGENDEASAKKIDAKKEQEKDEELLRKLDEVTFRLIYVDGQPVPAENVEIKFLPNFVPVFVSN